MIEMRIRKDPNLDLDLKQLNFRQIFYSITYTRSSINMEQIIPSFFRK